MHLFSETNWYKTITQIALALTAFASNKINCGASKFVRNIILRNKPFSLV